MAVLSTVANIATPGLPVGSIQAFAGANAPAGWLLCDGSAVTRGNYPDLYNTIGNTYGSGDGSTTFNLPDLRGRVPMGAGTGAQNGGSGSGVISGGTTLTARTRGGFGGDERLATHNHTATDSGHNHAFLRVNGNQQMYLANAASGGGVFGLSSGVGSILDVPNSTANITVQNNVGGGSGGNMPPFLVTNYIIKAIADIARGGWYTQSNPPVVTQLPLNPAYGETALLSTGGTALVYYWYSGSNWQQVSGVAQPAGSVIQTVITRMDTRTTYASSNTGNGNTITGLNLTITPRFSNSRIICEWTINGELHQDNVFLIHKDGSLVSDGYNTVLGNSRWSGMMSGFYDQNEDSTPSNWKLTYVDNSLGSTNARTYAPAIRSSSSSNFTLAVNRTLNGATQDAYESMVSYGIAMEIAQ